MRSMEDTTYVPPKVQALGSVMDLTAGYPTSSKAQNPVSDAVTPGTPGGQHNPTGFGVTTS